MDFNRISSREGGEAAGMLLSRYTVALRQSFRGLLDKVYDNVRLWLSSYFIVLIVCLHLEAAQNYSPL